MSATSSPGASVTPEGVRLRADVAGLGSRFIALTVDGLIQGVLLLGVFIGFAAGDLSGGAAAAVALGLVFAIVWLYYPLFEWLWAGRTPGKRAQGIRVVRTNGQPAGFAPVMVRNLIRIVDVFLLPFLAVIAMLLSSRGQRLGDLAAGTMVVRDRRLPSPHALDLGSGEPDVAGLDTSRLTEREYTLVRTFLARREGLDRAAREQLAGRVVATLTPLLGQAPDGRLPDEQLLEAIARSYRARFSGQDK